VKLYQVTTFHIGFKIEIITKDQSHTRHTTILLMSAWQIGQPIPIATTVSTQVVQKRAWPHGIWNKCYSISQPDEAHLTVACRYWRRWPETLCCRQWHGTVPYCCITQVANISLWTTVMQFHVVHFHVLQFGPSFLRLVFSAPPPHQGNIHWYCINRLLCVFHVDLPFDCHPLKLHVSVDVSLMGGGRWKYKT